MIKHFSKLISVVLVVSLIFSSSSIGFAASQSSDALAPYSISQLVSEYDKELAEISSDTAPKKMAQFKGRVSDFETYWVAQYAQDLAEKMIDRIKNVRSSGLLQISLQDAASELIAQINESALRHNVPIARREALVSAVNFELEKLITQNITTSESASIAPSIQKPLVRALAVEPVEWLTVQEATGRLNALKHINSMGALEQYYASLEGENVTYNEFLKRFRPELAQMADILKRARPVDELNVLVDNNQLVFDGEDANDPIVRDRQIMRLDILRSTSELLLQLLSSTEGINNTQHLKAVKSVFAKYPKESAQLVKYFETRFDPTKSLDERGEAAGNIRDAYLRELSQAKIDNLEERKVLEKALGIFIATVKTDYFVPGRTSLTFNIVPRAIVRDDEDRALIRTPPYAIIWVHVPYGAYGAHARYSDIARGGIRMINPDRTGMRDQILHECTKLSITQHKKHTDIPEGGSKGVFITEEGLNAVAAAIGYSDGLINCMMDNERIAVSSGANTIDPLELGPDEGTAQLANIMTARAWMKGLTTWRLLMTGKSQTLGGVSHMENDLLMPVTIGNRVTSQGVMQHAFPFIRYLRDIGTIQSKEGEPIALSVTGGLDGDVGSGITERAIDHYGDKVIIRGIVDGSGVMFDPSGLNHSALLSMYTSKAPAKLFPKDKLGAGGFVAVAKKGPGADSYITLDSASLSSMNTRALDPDVLKQMNVEKKYKSQAGLKESEPLITVLERDGQNRPTKVIVHTVYLRDAMFFLVKADMLITGGGVSNSIDKNTWPLFFDSDGKAVAAGITHGANVFTEEEASRAMEAKGVAIEPDEKANSVGVEISSRMEIDFNSIFEEKDMRRDLMASYFEQVLAKCLENARSKFWALRIDAEDKPTESVVTKISPSLSAEIIRLSDVIAKSTIVGDRKSDYGEMILERLRGYFPDVSSLDKEYPATLDRVFARMPTGRIKAIAAKVLAKEIVLNLGTNGVRDLAKITGAKDIVIIDKYFKSAHDLKTVEAVKNIVENKDNLSPKAQIAGLRDARNKLKFAIEESLAATDAVIDNVGQLTAQTAKHMILRVEGSIDLSTIVIVMKRDMTESITGESRMDGSRGSTLRDQYKIMKQGLRKVFGNGEGVIEVDTKGELIDRINELIARGLRVIILDDGSLTGDLSTDSINGKAGEKYCLISSGAVEEEDSAIIPYINLNAMAMMGVGVIYDDLTLFETAYQTFTGKEITEDLIAKLVNKVLWMVRALPRCIKITDELADQVKLRKLFEISV